MTKVLVLMSTWNGRKFISEQIQSILGQRFSGDISIMVRDDGSSDGTAEYLTSLKNDKIFILRGKNIGAKRSFFELLHMAKRQDADYFALCDQDDIWHFDKISRAISLMGESTPCLYASSLDLVDENSRFIRNYLHPGDRSFASTLICNFVTGCTCVINRRFLASMPFPNHAEETIMHDWWMASSATLGKKIVYDTESFINYRQHEGNHVGIKTGLLSILAKTFKMAFHRPTVTRFDHARELFFSAKNIFSDDQCAIVRDFLAGETSRWQRVKFVLRYRRNLSNRIAFRFVVFG